MATASIDLLAVPESTKSSKHDSSSAPSTPLPATPGTARSFGSFMSTATTQKDKRRAYKADQDLEPDIEECRYALQLFLESRMLESEVLLKEGDPKLERLYIATGYGLIQSVKAFMSYEDKDLGAALEMMKTGSNIASKHRKQVSLASRVTGLVIGTNPVPFYKSLTPVASN